mgnify:CR=1 FL=1
METGPYRLVRNPIYLADTLIYGCVALLWGSLWPWLLLPALIVVMQRGVIGHEERLLGELLLGSKEPAGLLSLTGGLAELESGRDRRVADVERHSASQVCQGGVRNQLR